MASNASGWPSNALELEAAQNRIAKQPAPAPWQPPSDEFAIGGCFVAFPRGVSGPGDSGDAAWASVVVMRGAHVVSQSLISGAAGAAYEPGLLALREGPLLEAAVRALDVTPDVLLVNATGLDHPRRCGLAFHLGAMVGLPTVGVTHRPLVASGEWPPDEAGATAPLMLDGVVAGYWLRTKAGTRPLAAHAGWRTAPDVAAEVVRRSLLGARTPAPIRLARQRARLTRQETGSGP